MLQDTLERSLSETYREDIQRLIKDDFVVDAIEKCQDFIRDLISDPASRSRYMRHIILLSGRYTRIRNARRDGVNPDETRTAIINDLLEITDELVEASAIRRELKLSSADAVLKEFRTIMGASGNTEYSVEDLKKTYFGYWRTQVRPDLRTVLRAVDITRRHRQSRFVLQPVSCEFRAGQITGIVGMNASGKTTFVRMLLGELVPSTGRVEYAGFSSVNRDWREIKSSTGYVPQLPAKWPGRLRHNLNHTAAAYGVTGSANADLVDQYVHRYGLYEYQDATWDQISGGYKIRFELVRALLTQPKVLILDEPLAYLDIVTQQIFLHDITTIAHSLERPIPIVITSQHLYEIEAIADQMIILDNGKCSFSGPIDDLPNPENYSIFEVALQNHRKSNLLETFRPKGLVDLERTATGWILIFERKLSRADIVAAIVDGLNEELIYFRDITRSTRVLFRNRRDDFGDFDLEAEM